jgi:hypothetical protein
MTTATLTLTEVEVCDVCGEAGDAEGYCGCFAPSSQPLEWTVWSETEATLEDAAPAETRTCSDCQHFRYQASISNGGGDGYCVGRSITVSSAYDLSMTRVEYPTRTATAKACPEIMPIGWCEAF